MNGSGGLLTEYSVGVCRDPADYQPHIHLVYAGVRRITNWIFINWARWIGIEYLIVGMIGLSGPGICGSEYSIVGIEYLIAQMIGLGGSELNIQ
jgi:hypothetical protein